MFWTLAMAGCTTVEATGEIPNKAYCFYRGPMASDNASVEFVVFGDGRNIR